MKAACGVSTRPGAVVTEGGTIVTRGVCHGSWGGGVRQRDRGGGVGLGGVARLRWAGRRDVVAVATMVAIVTRVAIAPWRMLRGRGGIARHGDCRDAVHGCRDTVGVVA